MIAADIVSIGTETDLTTGDSVCRCVIRIADTLVIEAFVGIEVHDQILALLRPGAVQAPRTLSPVRPGIQVREEMGEEIPVGNSDEMRRTFSGHLEFGGGHTGGVQAEPVLRRDEMNPLEELIAGGGQPLFVQAPTAPIRTARAVHVMHDELGYPIVSTAGAAALVIGDSELEGTESI